MERGWVKIATYTNELRGEMFKIALEQNGIAAVLLNKQDSSMKFGRIELFVQESEAKVARTIIQQETDHIDED